MPYISLEKRVLGCFSMGFKSTSWSFSFCRTHVIDNKTNNNVVHHYRLWETNRPPAQPLDPCPQRQVLPLYRHVYYLLVDAWFPAVVRIFQYEGFPGQSLSPHRYLCLAPSFPFFDTLVPPHTGHFAGLVVIGLSLRLGEYNTFTSSGHYPLTGITNTALIPCYATKQENPAKPRSAKK